MTPSRDIERLIEIMERLRDPLDGCPWDQEQTFASILPFTIEEAHEVADAIVRSDLDDLRDELGDLLLQVVYHAQMAREVGAFSFGDVVESITAKMIRRHPHVFGDREAREAGIAKGFWEEIKATERAVRGAGTRLLDEVKAGLPPLARATRLQNAAATVGFDWNSALAVLDKLREETEEVSAEAEKVPPDRDRLEDEIGDILFTVVNLARHFELDPEQALRRTNAKFISRFGAVERAVSESGRTLDDATLDEMEALWSDAKAAEKSATAGG